MLQETFIVKKMMLLQKNGGQREWNYFKTITANNFTDW